MSVLKKLAPVALLFIAVLALFFLPVSSILLYGEPMNTGVQDAVRTSTENVEGRDFSSTDIDTFANTEFVFYVPPAYMIEMTNFGYLDDAWYWNGDDNNGGSYSNGCRDSEYYNPIANCSVVMISAYEREAEVTVEWLNATAVECHYDEYYGWQVEQGAEVIWASDIPSYSEGAVTLNTEWTYTVREFDYLEIPVISWEIAPGWHILSGSVRVTSDVPVTVMHHKLNPGFATDTPDDHWANAWWNDVFCGYGKKLMVRVAGELWITALEAPTEVQVWDLSDHDDDASFELDTFEGWSSDRNPILQQDGFDDDLVLISATNPVMVMGGIQSRHSFSQVHGKDGKDFLFPSFGKVLIHAPEGASLFLEDHSGNQGSFEGDMSPGETREFDFKVVYKSRCYSSWEWAHLRASKPVYVYTFSNFQWTLNDDYYGTMHGEDYLTVYKKTSLYFPQGYKPYPASTEFEVPINSRAYVTVQNLDNTNSIRVDFSELSLPLALELPPFGTMTMEISENSYEYVDLEGQYARETEAFWSNRNHPFVYRIVVDNNKREEIYLTRDNITKGTTLTVKAEKDVMVFVDYGRDYQRYVTGVDLIPGLAAPQTRGLPEGQPLLVAIGGIVVAADILVVMGGRRPLIEQLLRWRT
jgi:hypothetical protein